MRPAAREMRHVGCVTWGASRGVRHVGCVTWAASRGVRHVGCVTWGASRGVRHVGCVTWGASRVVSRAASCIWDGSRAIRYTRGGHHARCVTRCVSSGARQRALRCRLRRRVPWFCGIQRVTYPA